MLGPADLEAWLEDQIDQPESPDEPAREPAAPRSRPAFRSPFGAFSPYGTMFGWPHRRTGRGG